MTTGTGMLQYLTSEEFLVMTDAIYGRWKLPYKITKLFDYTNRKMVEIELENGEKHRVVIEKDRTTVG